MATTNFQSVDEYITSFPSDVRDVLGKVRQTIHNAVPAAREKISYQMAAFTLDGNLVYYSAWKEHIGLYGVSGALQAFKDELAPYAGDRGSLRFPLNEPIPYDLIARIVEFGARENAEKARLKRDQRKLRAGQCSRKEPAG